MGKEEERTQGPNREAAQRPHAVYQPWKWSSPTGCFLLFSFCVNKLLSSLLLLPHLRLWPPSVLACVSVKNLDSLAAILRPSL